MCHPACMSCRVVPQSRGCHPSPLPRLRHLFRLRRFQQRQARPAPHQRRLGPIRTHRRPRSFHHWHQRNLRPPHPLHREASEDTYGSRSRSETLTSRPRFAPQRARKHLKRATSPTLKHWLKLPAVPIDRAPKPVARFFDLVLRPRGRDFASTRSGRATREAVSRLRGERKTSTRGRHWRFRYTFDHHCKCWLRPKIRRPRTSSLSKC